MNKKHAIKIVVLLASTCWVIGCSTIQQFKNMADSGIDATHDAQGNVTLLDTPRMWQEFVFMTDLSIQNEVAHSRYTGGMANEEGRLRSMHSIRKTTEHPQKYIDYIIEARRSAGLPEIDIAYDAQGQMILADTPNTWQDFKTFVDICIEDEIKRGIGADATNEDWRRILRNNESMREHPGKFRDYLLEKRRAAGLPELKG